MSNKIKNIIKLPEWLIKAIRRHQHELPIDNPEISDALIHIDYAFEEYAKRFNELEAKRDFKIMIGEEFLAIFGTHQEGSKPELFTHSATALRQYYNDQIETAELYNYLVLTRGMQLVKAFTRDARTQDIFAMALSGRAILELGIFAADAMRHPLSIFRSLAETGVMYFGNDLGKKTEEPLRSAIWGTRIGEAALKDKKGDSDTKRYSGKVSLQGFETAKNIMSAIQGRAKRMDDGEGKAEYQIYEILCDIVHPSAFGYQLLISGSDAPTHYHGYSVKKNELSEPFASYVASASAFGAYQGCSLILEIDKNLKPDIPVCKEKLRDIQRRLDSGSDAAG